MKVELANSSESLHALHKSVITFGESCQKTTRTVLERLAALSRFSSQILWVISSANLFMLIHARSVNSSSCDLDFIYDVLCSKIDGGNWIGCPRISNDVMVIRAKMKKSNKYIEKKHLMCFTLPTVQFWKISGKYTDQTFYHTRYHNTLMCCLVKIGLWKGISWGGIHMKLLKISGNV